MPVIETKSFIVNILKFFLENYNDIILYIFSIALIIQLFYYLGIYSRFVFYRGKKATKKYNPLSVIICAKNEESNLEKNLPSILEQDYPDYEVIVVNDCSTDDTDLVIGKFIKKYKHLRTTSISEDKKFKHGKKLALTIGIKAAKSEHLIFTDADCKAESNKWLKLISRNFSKEKTIILGYGAYYSKNSLLNNYIRYDTLTIAIQYMGYALSGMPYMGVGRNLAYTKTLFFANKGYASHINLLSGDDDLFINEIATKSNTTIEITEGSRTYSEPENSLVKWIKQKKRHLTTAKYYKKKHKFFLCLEPFSRLIYYSALTYLLITQYFFELVLLAASIRFICQFIIYKRAINRLNEKKLLISSFLFDVFSMFINFMIYVSKNIRFNKNRWK